MRRVAEEYGTEHPGRGRQAARRSSRRSRPSSAAARRGSGSRSRPSCSSSTTRRCSSRSNDKHDTHAPAAARPAARCPSADRRRAGRRAPARDGQAGRHPGVGPHLGRGHRRRCASCAEERQGHLPRRADRDGRPRRLGRGELHREAEGRPGSRQPRRRLEPRRRRSRRPRR